MPALTVCGGEETPGDYGPSKPVEAATFANPVYDTNFPDPFILRVGETYHAYSTNDAEANVPTLRSGDLVDWKKGEDSMPDLAPWVTPGQTWAPEVLSREGGGYVLYYTAASTAEGRQCVGRAVGDSPEGPYVERAGKPFVCQVKEGGSIDASPFVDGTEGCTCCGRTTQTRSVATPISTPRGCLQTAWISSANPSGSSSRMPRGRGNGSRRR